RQLTRREQLTHLRPRQRHAVLVPVRARLRRRHLAADLAPERVLEEHRLDVELVRLELVEDELRVVGAVVAPDARVVAADDEVRAAIVLAADRVPDRLARPGVAHGRRERRQDYAAPRVVVLEQDAVALDPRRGGDVVRLRLADQRVDEQAVDRLERALRQILVRPVDRVPGLEADDALPAPLGKDPARVARVRVLGRAEAALRLPLLVVLVRLVDVQHREQTPLLVGERHPIAARRRVDGEADGERPRQAAREPHRLDDALVVLAVQEALERRESACREHVQVGHLARGQRQTLERVDAVGALPGAVDELPAVGLDQPGGVGRDRHQAATSAAGTSPSTSSCSTTIRALSSGVCVSVSTTISGESGASYGSSTPVKPLISPANAFAYRPFTSRRAHSSTDAFTNTSTNDPNCSTIARAFLRISP